MAIAVEDLKPGVRVRWLSGHHPGSICEVQRVQPNYVEFRGVPGGGAPARLQRRPFRIKLDAVTTRAELVKEERVVQPAAVMVMKAAMAPLEIEEAPPAELPRWVPSPEQMAVFKTQNSAERDVVNVMMRCGISDHDLDVALRGWGTPHTAQCMGVSAYALNTVRVKWGLYSPGKGQQPSGFVPPAIVNKFPHPAPRKLQSRNGPVTVRHAEKPKSDTVSPPVGPLAEIVELLTQKRTAMVQEEGRLRQLLDDCVKARQAVESAIATLNNPKEVK